MVIPSKSLLQNFTQFLKRFERPQRTYILPTSFGMAAALLIILMLLLAFVYSNNLVYAAVFFVASFCIQNMIRCAKNIEKLYVHDVHEVEIFANEAASCFFEVENRGRWAIINSEVIADQFTQKVLIPEVHEKQKVQFQVDVTFQKRGYHPFSGLNIQSEFPFEMFRSWKKVRFKKQLLIFPKRQGLSLFQTRSAQQQLHDQDDFLNHEVYNGSQSFLRIDWKIYARLQKLMIKKYGSGSEINTDFTWEQTESLEDSELRISQLTLWISECHKKSLDFSLHLPHRFFRKSSQHAHYLECLKELALWKP